MTDYKIGDIVRFGPYDWRVLAVEDEEALLITKDCLPDYQRYHSESKSITWADCDLRKWLNREFYYSFDAEKRRIVRKHVDNPDNKTYNTKAHKIVGDYIFCLSIDEARKYFVNDTDRVAQYRGNADWWWLRSLGDYQRNAATVITGGSVYTGGIDVISDSVAVRPALWLNMGKPAKESTVPETKPKTLDIPKSVPALAQTKTKIDSPAVDSTIKFGPYDWRVLEVDENNNRILLLSDKLLEKRRYHSSDIDTTWAQCELREHLNSEANDGFLCSFTDAERRMIQPTLISTADNKWYGKKGGADITDRVFLLSIEEVLKYFGDSGDYDAKVRWWWKDSKLVKAKNGNCLHDQYDNARIAHMYDSGNTALWWLRSPGNRQRRAATVRRVGYVSVSGDPVNDSVAVRPALWLNASAVREAFESGELQVSVTPSLSLPPTPAQAPAGVSEIKVGNSIKFGSYDWRVLAVEDGEALLITKDCLPGCRRYHSVSESITWADCDLRKWLNDTFYDSFGGKKSHIVRKHLDNPDHEKYYTEWGNPTDDYIFCLSINEARKYFMDDADRVAFCRGKVLRWWLRSPGRHQNSTAGVGSGGYVKTSGYDVCHAGLAVRPALWLKL
jgi:hypothetical protein